MHCKHGEKSVISLELRKLRVKSRKEDKLSTGDISKTVEKSKSVIHCILRKLEETGSCEAKKPPGRPHKITIREDRGIGKESKKKWFATVKQLMLTLALKYQDTLFPEDLMK